MTQHRRIIDEGSLWIMVAVPSVWAAHFLLVYWVAAVWCAKLGRDAGLDPVRLAILGLTVLALGVVGWLAWMAWRDYAGRLPLGGEIEEDTDDGRRRFMGQATLMLAILSAVAILFDAIPALVFERCG